MNNKLEDDLILEEYKSLRAEVLSKMDKQYQIIFIGTTGIAALVSFAIKEKMYSLFLILPLIIIFVVGRYLLESVAIQNIGEYIYTYAEDLIDMRTMGWERWLRKDNKRTRQYRIIEFSTMIFLSVIFLVCIYVIIISPPTDGGLELINSPHLRYLIALLYLLFGVIFVYLLFISEIKISKDLSSNKFKPKT